MRWFACSAASVIFMAGDERIMNSASLLMIHNAWSYGSGNANDFRKKAEDLDKITQASINAYMSRVKITEDELKEKMDKESWLTAEEALADGFATQIMEENDDGVSQSAFTVIREKLLADTAVPAQAKALEAVLDTEGIAGEIAGKVVEALQKEKQKTEKQETSTGWGAFLIQKKESRICLLMKTTRSYRQK